MAVRLVLIAAVVATAFSVAAAARDGTAPKPVPSRQLTGVFAPDPTGVWRTITQTDSTSDCIGDLVTPMCTIDTVMACGVWLKGQLCRQAWGNVDPDFKFYTTPADDSYLYYRVVSVRIARAKDIDNTQHRRKIGDNLIGVITSNCVVSDEYCVTDGMPLTYSIRKFEDRWLIVDLYAPRY